MKSVFVMYFVCVQSLRRPAHLVADLDGGESGSDYGDWENDDWSVDSFATPITSKPAPQSKTQHSTKVGQCTAHPWVWRHFKQVAFPLVVISPC